MTIGPALRASYALALMAFLLSPLVIIVAVSFNADEFITFPPAGYSLRWYRQLAEDPGLLASAGLSLRVGVFAALLALAVALPTSQMLARHRSRLSAPLRALTFSPLLLPEVLLGLALLQLTGLLGGAPSFGLMLAAHTMVVLPFSVQIITASLLRFDPHIEEAALTLGATPVRAWVGVTLPGLRAAIVYALLLSFVFSFDNVSISLFLASPGLTTLPVRIYEYATYSSDPSLAAVSAVLIYAGLSLMMLIARLRGIQRPASPR